MTHQSEQELEKILLNQLQGLGFKYVIIPDNDGLELNLKEQLEKFNNTTFSDTEFIKILNHLNKGDRFKKAETLRDRFAFKKDDGTDASIRFFNTDQWCKNEYQVTNQVTQVGSYENRYDVTLLINGLPLVQMELKRLGMELKEAFNQVQRYHKHSYAGSLFEYIQIFVISNGVNTKYFSNNPKQNFAQTFFWTDEHNEPITGLKEFADVFLEKCAVSQMIAEYIVLAQSKRIPMILRPYQYYAVRKLVDRVKESDKNGYIWHTTGSGKTLTSYKASQILTTLPKVKKVLFVVDRKDLDIQTTKEFNSFSAGSVDGTTKTKKLVEQLKDPNTPLIVTTIQKLDIAIGKESYKKQFAELKNEKVVIIFDECHRSQFGQTHARIKDFFKRGQLFGFTGTPIFAENHVGKVTTADVFGEALHRYIITNAIADDNVLGFSVEYVGKYKKKEPDTLNLEIESDIEVEGIDTQEVLESDARLEKITNYILSDWKRKTKNGQFNALFATPRIEVLKKYYTLFKKNKPDDFSIATIFTYQANEDEYADVLDGDVMPDENDPINQHSRDFLETCIQDYNEQFGTNFSTNEFYQYYNDLQARIKNKEIDLVIVVNMFLTGFDSDTLNTLYVDKNLRYHGLVQAYSRTNRLHGPSKPHGNIVTFRNLKDATDKALRLFGDESANEVVFKKPYDLQKKEFNEQLNELKDVVPTFETVSEIQSEAEKVKFVELFRSLLRMKSSLETFAEFTFDDLGIDEQEFENYQSKYLDLYEVRKNKDGKELESILDQIDFELELIRKDVVNFDYIIQLIVGLKDVMSDSVRQKKTEDLLKIFDRDVQLRKKKELIQKFIEENLPMVGKSDNVEQVFEEFWHSEQSSALREIAVAEHIEQDAFQALIGDYIYSQKVPLGDDIIALMPDNKKPKALDRTSVTERIKNKIIELVDIFEW